MTWGYSGGGGIANGTYPTKGDLDASLAANLPSSPSDGDTYRISVGGTFESDASIEPSGFVFTVNDYVKWVDTISKWKAIETGDDVLKTTAQTLSAGEKTQAKTNIDLQNVSNDAQLKIASNLSDLNNAGTARTNLGLGTMATQASDSVSITGGSVTGITDLAVADGGTGASNEAGARTNLDVFSKSEAFTADKYKTWTDWTIPNTDTLAFPPFTVFDWFEHINFIATEPFEMMVRIQGQAGTSLAHYAEVGQQASTDDELHQLLASALTAVTGTTGSFDSVTGTTRFVENHRLKSQDNGDGTHSIWFTIGDNTTPTQNRYQLGTNFNIVTSTSNFSLTRVRLADQQAMDGLGTFQDVESLTSSTIQIDLTDSAKNLQISNNLSDLANAGTARTNLGLTNSATLLHKLDATVDPTVNDDSGDGYAVGSIWVNVTSNEAFILVDSTVGSAVWQSTTSGGGGLTEQQVTDIAFLNAIIFG